MKPHTVCPSTSGVGVAHSAAVAGGVFRHLLSNPSANTLKMSSGVLPGADRYSRANQPESVTQENPIHAVTDHTLRTQRLIMK